MKKILSMVLALILCMGAVALAESTPSITVQDVTTPAVEAVAENGRTVTIIIREDDASAAQLRILQATTVKDDYFGDIVKQDGTMSKLSELLDPADINEFATIIVENYDPSFGAVTAKITFKTTKYEMTDKLYVLIGLLDGTLNWYAFDGEVIDDQGAIRVVFPADIMEKIQSGNGLIAIASQSAAAEGASGGASAGSNGAQE